MNQTASKSLLRFSLWTQAKIWGHKKTNETKKHARVIFHLFAGTPHLGDRFEFWRAGHIADVITRINFLTIGSGVSEFCIH